jgi:phosphoglycolate phosphatase
MRLLIMTYKAVIFDLDGTLLDTLEDIGNAVNHALARSGYPEHRLADYRHFIGDGPRTLIERVLPEEAREDGIIDAHVAAYRREYSQKWNVKTKPYDGIVDLLDALHGRGIRMAILSNKPHDFTQMCLSAFFPHCPFDPVYGLREGFPRKPDPAGAVEIAELLRIPPASFLFVGDSGIDMMTANAAGMHPVGALWGFRPEAELREAGAKTLIVKPLDLLDILK